MEPMRVWVAGFALGTLLVASSAFAHGDQVFAVFYHSNPEGAKVLDIDGTIGITPFITTYDLPKDYAAGQCIAVRSLGVIWITGVHVMQHNPKVCPENGRNQQTVTFDIPPGESNRYIQAFAISPQVLQAASHIRALVQNGTPLTIGPDQAALTRAYQNANEEAHEDLGRRIAATKARIQMLDSAIQAQQYQDVMSNAIREQRNTDAIYDAAGDAGNVLGHAAAGNFESTQPPLVYPATPKITLPVTAKPFSDPPVTCRLGPMGTSATCH